MDKSLPGSEPFTVSKNWLVLPAIALLLGAFLLLPSPYRDIMLALVVVTGVAAGLLKTDLVWLAMLMFLPLLRLGGELFQLNGFTVPRLLIVPFAAVVFLKYYDPAKINALLCSNGFRFFALFLLANILSGIALGQMPALFAALTYLEPLLYFATSYYLVAVGQLTVPRILGAILLGAVPVAGVAVYEVVTQQSVGAMLWPAMQSTLTRYMTGYDSNRFGWGGRISSLIAHPVFASLYWVIILTIGIYYFHQIKRSRWLAGALIVPCLGLLLITATRAGMLALAVALLVLIIFGLQSMQQRALVIGAVLAGTVLVGVLSPNLAGYLGASFTGDPNIKASRNLVYRVAVTTELLAIFQSHWFLGYGPGRVQREAVAGTLPKAEGLYSLAGLENQYATILADGGIIAGLCYLLFVVGALRDALRMMNDPPRRAQGVVLLALFSAYFVFAATAATLIEIPNLLLMAIYGAFAADFMNGTAAQKQTRASHV